MKEWRTRRPCVVRRSKIRRIFVQVSYLIKGSGNWVVLFDQVLGAGVTMPDFKGSAKFNSNKSPGFGSVSQSITPMGNAIVNLQWKFGITYASLAAATAAVRTMQSLGETTLSLRVVQDSETQYYPYGVVDDYSWEQNGAYVLHSISFVQQLVTQTVPT